MKKLVSLLLIIPNICFASQESEAYTKAGEAFYKQSGIERYVNRLVEKNINEDLRNWSGNVILAYKVIQDRQIIYTWKF